MTKNFRIELLPCYQRFRAPRTPTLWEYSNAYAKHYGVLYSYKGVRYFSGTAREFLKLVERTEKAEPTFKPYEVEKSIDHWNASRASRNPWWHFAVSPDGQVFLNTVGWSFWKTIVWAEDGPWYRYMTDSVDGPDDPHRHPSWQKTSRKTELLEEKYFLPAYKAARKSWIQEQKKNGSWGKAQEKYRARKLADRTNRKMAVCNQTTTLIQELQQYLKDINNGTATQKQVGQLYNKMMKLASLNKKTKTLFPKE